MSRRHGLLPVAALLSHADMTAMTHRIAVPSATVSATAIL